MTTPIEEARPLSDESEVIVRGALGLLQRLLKKAGATPGRTTAQGMRDAAKPDAVDTDAATKDDTKTDTNKAKPYGKAVKGTTAQGMREARLSEAGQDGMSFKDVARAVQSAIVERIGGGYITIRDLFATTVVYAVGWGEEADLFRVPYAIDADGTVTLGDAEDVIAQVIYVPEDADVDADGCPYCGGELSTGDADPSPVPADFTARMGDDGITEAAALELAGDVVALREGAVGTNGQARIKLIAPGWGSSGYYSPDVLKRDGPAAFPQGTKMYWDHPTITEEAERPERSLRDLAAELTSDAQWQDDAANGPGLYASATVFPTFAESVDALAPYIGTSIRALGRAEAGEAEGRSGAIVTQIAAGKSVDFVTTPGAGGKVLQLFEAARRGAPLATSTPQKETPIVNETEAKALRESNVALTAQIARLQERQLLNDARAVASAVLGGIDMHPQTRSRLVESLVNKAPVADGALDEAAFTTMVEAAAIAEQTYLASLSESGQIVGMGSTRPAETTLEASQAQLNEALQTLGLSESGAKIAAGR